MSLKTKRILRVSALIVGILILGLYILLPVVMGVITIIPARQEVGVPPGGFEEISLTTEDGETLFAWYRPTENGAAIILLHGAGGSREEVRPYAAMLARNGYGVLAMDLRGHGRSSGKTSRLGWSSTPDIGAAVDYLQRRGGVKAIDGLGLSMGGEVLLGAASQYPVIEAMVTDGATRRSIEELLALPSERPLVRNFTARVMYATVRLLNGDPPPKPLLESMVEAQHTHFLWIAAGSNDLEVAFNQLFAETLGERGSLWVAPEASHTGAFSRYPDAYEERVITFFGRTLLGRP